MFTLNFIITSISLVLQCCEIVEAATCGTNFPFNLSSSECVFLSNEKASYCDAQRSCQQRNGELLTGESQLASFMKTLGPKQEFWIGLTLLYQSKSYKLLSTAAERRKSFRWTNNSFRNATTYWYQSSPYNTGTGYYAREYCAKRWPFKNENVLGDLSCNFRLNYICQPKIEMFISSKVFQLDDATVLEFTSGGCFSAAVKVKNLLCCATLCVKNSVCSSFYHNRASQRCVLVLFTDATSSNYKQVDGWERYRGQ